MVPELIGWVTLTKTSPSASLASPETVKNELKSITEVRVTHMSVGAATGGVLKEIYFKISHVSLIPVLLKEFKQCAL